MMFTMPKGNDSCVYYGLGEHENYADKRLSSIYGVYRKNISDMSYDYIKPQETGSRSGVKWVFVGNHGGLGLLAVSTGEFSFNASHYTADDLEYAAHNYDLEEREQTFFCIDYKMSGVGSNACGPELMEKYRLDENEIEFKFAVKPVLFEDEM